MSRNPYRRGFTLVELLVVIGIIALLIAVLLPALSKARQQANLLVCQSNMRSMGQVFAIYSAEQRGYLPWGNGNVSNLQYWSWPDLLTVTAYRDSTRAVMQVSGNGWWPAVTQANMAVDVSSMFHDVDVPSVPFALRAPCYNGNPRLLPDSGGSDRVSGTAVAPHIRTLGSVQRSSEVILVWDGSLMITNGQIIGTGNVVDYQLDQSQWTWGHCFAMPHSGISDKVYGSVVAPGNNGWASSYAANSVTKSVQISENVDAVNAAWNPNSLRYRHQGNKVANVLFVDGHVEGKQMGEILARNICVNP